MKKFKYRVEPYLKFLGFEREKVLKKLKQAEAHWRSLVEKFHWMESEMKKAYELNSQFGKGISDVNLINDNNQFIQNLKRHMRDLSEEIAIAEQDYHKKYKELLEAQLKLKKIETHKEQEKEKYMKEVRKKQQLMTDEINSARYGKEG